MSSLLLIDLRANLAASHRDANEHPSANQPADDIYAVDEMEINFGEHVIAFIHPKRSCGFVDEPILEVAVRKLFIGRLETDQCFRKFFKWR